MKKIFLFAAAVAATMALNAASFTGFDFRDGSLGTKIHDEGLLNTAVNVTLNETDATDHKYEIKNTEAGEMGFEIGGVEFSYSDQQAGKVAFKTTKTYISPNGVRRLVTIPTTAGEKVLVYAQDAISGIGVEGVKGKTTIDLKGWGENKDVYTELEASGSAIVIRSDNGEEGTTAKLVWKIGAILPADAQGINNTDAAVKVEKFYRDGQLIIRKNGVEYNALGTRL